MRHLIPAFFLLVVLAGVGLWHFSLRHAAARGRAQAEAAQSAIWGTAEEQRQQRIDTLRRTIAEWEDQLPTAAEDSPTRQVILEELEKFRAELRQAEAATGP